jgi:hypothetical protein
MSESMEAGTSSAGACSAERAFIAGAGFRGLGCDGQESKRLKRRYFESVREYLDTGLFQIEG